MLVSVVIPVRDDAEMLRSCLEALAAQTRPLDELVIVDNGSSDDSAEVAESAGALVLWEPIAGIPRAASAGYDAASGDLIVRIDADSVCPPDWLARLVERFEAQPGLSVLTGAGRFYGSSRLVHSLGERYYLGGMHWAMTPYLGHPPIFGSNFAMRGSVWEELRGEVHREDRRIHDDLDLSLHIKPWMHVEYDPTIEVGISARPFATLGGLTRRVSWVVPTLRHHWSAETPWRRRSHRRQWRREAGRASSAG